MKCTPRELNSMDMGVHMQLYHEWNEETSGTWHDANVLYGFPISVVTQRYTPHSHLNESDFMCVATYDTTGEGDLLELYFADTRNGVGYNYYAETTNSRFSASNKYLGRGTSGVGFPD